jgi:hypothetical protein
MKSPEPPGQTVKRYGVAESGAERWLAGNSKDLVPERPQHSSVESWPKAQAWEVFLGVFGHEQPKNEVPRAPRADREKIRRGRVWCRTLAGREL